MIVEQVINFLEGKALHLPIVRDNEDGTVSELVQIGEIRDSDGRKCIFMEFEDNEG